MSYITIALKRAHKANDDRYLPYRDIISSGRGAGFGERNA